MRTATLVIQERTALSRARRRIRSVFKARSKTEVAATGAQLGVGIVGVGNVARWAYLPRLRSSSVMNLVAVHDVDPVAAASVAEREGVRRASSLEDLLADDAVQVVCICTPELYHAEAAIAALATGRHVLCEKPLAASVEEARAMVRAAQHASTATMVNFSFRFRPEFCFLSSLLNAGTLGRVLLVQGTLSQGGWFTANGEPGRQRSDIAAWKLGPDGGVLGDLGPHLIDLLCGCLGEVSTVQAWMNAFGSETASDDACGLILDFERGARAHVTTTRWATGYREHTFFEISGTDGAVRFVDGAISLWTRDDPRWRRLLVPDTSGRDFLDTFYALIQNRADSDVPSFRDGLRNCEILAAVRESAASNAVVGLSARHRLALEIARVGTERRAHLGRSPDRRGDAVLSSASLSRIR